MMAPGMDHSAVGEAVRPARLAWDDMVRMERLINVEWQAAECTTVGLRRQQRLALLRVRPHRDPLLAALLPVGMQFRVIWAVPPTDLHKARDRGCAVPDQLDPLRMEGPVAIAAEVAAPHPPTGFLGVSALGPLPEHLPLAVIRALEGCTGYAMTVVIGPASDDRGQVFYHPSGGGLLMGVQVGFDLPQMPEHLVLLGLRQQPPLIAPDLEPQEVKPFRDVHDPGFGLAERQAPLPKKIFDPGPNVLLQYFP